MAATIISIVVAVLVGFLVWSHLRLLQRIPAAGAPAGDESPVTSTGDGSEPLTIDRIADAIRFNGYVPEIREDTVFFRVQGETYFVDAERLPLFFLIKGYNIDPADWDVDLMREAAHRMSDELAMVKAGVSDDDKVIRFFIAAQDRNYASFRDNLPAYLNILEGGQHFHNEEYVRLDEKRNETLNAQPVIPSPVTENKILS